MEKYDYKKAIINDIKNYIKDNSQEWPDPYEVDEIEEYWIDHLWDKDCITGNGGNWYDTEENCSEYLNGNFDLLYETSRDYWIEDDIRAIIKYYQDKSIARYFDCLIRCYLFNECICKALEELNES